MMRSYILLIVTLANILLFGQSIDAAETKSPEFKFITFEGDTIQSKELEGKVILLDFWNSGCIPCRKSFPVLEKVYKKYKDNPKVSIFIVNSGWEPIEKARKFLKKKWYHQPLFSKRKYRWNLPFAYDHNSVTFNGFELKGNPSTIIIDNNFTIRQKIIGAEPEVDLFKKLTGIIDKLITERKNKSE